MSTDVSGMIECRVRSPPAVGPHYAHGTTWLPRAELDTTDWQETNDSGTRTRASAAGTDIDRGRVWSVMRILSEVHGAENVRLVVWFD
ncbi:hypothetical protein ABZY31_26810 [Streptomyces sp. NPDC006529]|uniref:hypothetical protein n=1 Tax=Streptomyces sp. NPDC006529 TaxID=3157177 RepID=UPI0033A60915